jgi:hypothetical protein
VSATAEQGAAPAVDGAAPAGDGWQRDRRGREYVRARGRRGIVYRQGAETVEEALSRPAHAGDQPPRARTPRKPPPPSSVDLRELEKLLAEVFRSPAIPAGAFLAGVDGGWTADHFTNTGPYLARNLVLAAEHNPWLRQKLEKAATGGDLAMRLAAMLPLAGATIMYVVPPLVYWLNLPMPQQGRAMFGIPDRRPPDHAVPAPPPAPSSPAAA